MSLGSRITPEVEPVQKAADLVSSLGYNDAVTVVKRLHAAFKSPARKVERDYWVDVLYYLDNNE